MPAGLLGMAAQTSKTPPVAHRAGWLVEGFGGPAVPFQVIRCMTYRLQFGTLRMTRLAAEWVFDFGVAHQAIRHLRHGGRRHGIGFFHAAVAGGAGIRRVQVSANVAGR